jgi:hypothetical protein
VLSPDIPCLAVRSGSSQSARAVLWPLVEGDLEPVHPIAATLATSSEAIDALLGTKLGSPRVVPDQTKLAFTDCTSRGFAGSRTFGAVGHCCLLLVLSSLFVDHSFFTVAFHKPVRFSNPCILGRWRSAAQLSGGNRQSSKGASELYEGLRARP